MPALGSLPDPLSCSEAALASTPVRSGLGAEMPPEEAEAVRRGLLALRQNVVLLRDPEDPNAFYPVRRAPWCRQPLQVQQPI